MLSANTELLDIIRRSLAHADHPTRPHVVSLRMSGLDLIRFVRLTNQDVNDAERHKALDQLTAEAQAMGFYDPPKKKDTNP